MGKEDENDLAVAIRDAGFAIATELARVADALFIHADYEEDCDEQDEEPDNPQGLLNPERGGDI